MTEIHNSVRNLTLHIKSGKLGEENENCSDNPCNSPYDACILRHAGSGNEKDKNQE